MEQIFNTLNKGKTNYPLAKKWMDKKEEYLLMWSSHKIDSK